MAEREDEFGLLNRLLSPDLEFNHAVEFLAICSDEVVDSIHVVLENCALYADTEQLRELASKAIRAAQRRHTDPRIRHAVALRQFVADHRYVAGTDACVEYDVDRDGQLEPWRGEQRIIAKPPHGSRTSDTLYEFLGVCASPACPSETALHLLAELNDWAVLEMRDVVEEQALYGLDPEAHRTARDVLRDVVAESRAGRHASVSLVLAFVERLRLLDGGSRLPRQYTLTRGERAVRVAELTDTILGDIAAKRGAPAPPPTDVQEVTHRLEAADNRFRADPERYAGEEGLARFKQESVDEMVDRVLEQTRLAGS